MSQTASNLLFSVFIALAMAGMSLAAQGLNDGLRVTNRTPEPTTLPTGATVKPTRVHRTATVLDGVDLDRVVRNIYGKFAHTSESSGHPVQLTPGPLKTHLPNAFTQIRWLDLFTPSDLVLRTTPHGRAGALPSERLVSYRSTWEETDVAAWYAQNFVKSGPLTVRDALKVLREHWPTRFAHVAAVSSFEVELEFEGRRRVYRAAIVWTPLSTGDLLFSLIDRVVPAADLPFHESRTIVTLDELAAVETPTEPSVFNKLSCLAGTENYSLERADSGFVTDGHVTGAHRSWLGMNYTCHTQANCTALASQTVRTSQCTDFGNVAGISTHETRVGIEQECVSGSIDKAHCGYVWGCAIVKCALGFCGSIRFGFSGRGASLDVEISGDVFSPIQQKSSFYCPRTLIGQGGGAGSCLTTTSDVQVLSLSGPAPKLQSADDEVPLNRVEPSDVIHHGQPLRYVMGEWAVISYSTGKLSGGDRVRSLRASSEEFARSRTAQLVEILESEVFAHKAQPLQEHTALIVALPPHEDNDRYIPMPTLRVAPNSVPIGSGRGQILARLDFGEDHQLQGLDILHNTVGGVRPDLALAIQRAVSLERVIEKDHRVIVFATISVNDTLDLVQTLSYLPKCFQPQCD